MKFTTSNKLSTFINNNISEVDIFSKYLNIPSTEIYKCINNKSYRVKNTLRDDKNPSLGFQYLNIRNRSKLYAKDFANPFYIGDAYYFVGLVLGLHCNIPRDFINICKHIIHKFKIGDIPSISRKEPMINNEPTITTIEVERRKWDKYDIAYWNMYGITPSMLESEEVYPINKFWINNELQDYFYEITNPAYAYYLGYDTVDLWEIYRPFDYKYNKFRTNNTSDIKELHKISNNHNLIITKSKKDLMLIKTLLKDLGITYTDVLYTSENNRLKSTTKSLIDSNYRNVYVNFDIDIAGINGMKFYNKSYGYNIFPFIPSNIPDITVYPKDISDFCKRYKYVNTLKLFNYLYNEYIL